MKRNKKKKNQFFQNCSFLALKFTFFIVQRIPLSWHSRIVVFLSRIAYSLNKKQRAIALESIAQAFPSYNRQWREKKIRDFFSQMIAMPLEMIYYIHHSSNLENIEIHGKENLDRALSRGLGVVGLTAHMGNFPLMHLKLASLGYPVSVMTRPMRDIRTGDYFDSIRKRAGIETVYSLPRREAVKSTIASLRKNRLVVMQMDQDFKAEGVQVDFFGKPASTPVGPIVFALRVGCPVIPMIIVREKGYQQRVLIFPELILEKVDDHQETLKRNARKYNIWLEDCIKQYPSQWGWIHRRWKSN